MNSSTRMIIENKRSSGQLEEQRDRRERAIQSVQGMIRTIRSTIEEHWEVRIGVAHSVWSWIAEQSGIVPTRFEVGRDGKTAHGRLKGKSAKVQGVSVA